VRSPALLHLGQEGFQSLPFGPLLVELSLQLDNILGMRLAFVRQPALVRLVLGF
jgi:hypothetical protein